VGGFLLAYVKSMRLYYAFITGITGWIGVAFYQFLEPGRTSLGRSTLILVLLFLSWGVNQIVNDYLGLAEDRINAPHRPMVTGELPVRPALLLTGALLAGTLLVSYLLNPWAALAAALAIALNVLYEYAKAWSMVANLVFGVMIAMCAVFGFLACGPAPEVLLTSNRICGLIIIAAANGLMTYFTYFKDYEGDRRAGKHTFIARHGPAIGRVVGLIGTVLLFLLLVLVLVAGWIPAADILFPRTFLFCCLVAGALQFWNVYLYFRNPAGRATYFNLKYNFRACVATEITLIALFHETLALYLLIVSYILIGFLFAFHRDAKA
jgi:geranylgeranylglycerol-phosphate geranylgeranyltransferase